RVAVNQLLGRHLVDERNGVPKRVLDLGRILAVDRRPDVPERAAQARAEVPVVFPAFDVLTVRLERGIVTCHSRKSSFLTPRAQSSTPGAPPPSAWMLPEPWYPQLEAGTTNC